jgi:3-dehydroquinate dehydratase-2
MSGPAPNPVKHVLVLHGPNLNLLGEREPEIYGTTTLAQVDTMISDRAAALGLSVRIFQSNHEGALIDRIHAERKWAHAIVINPAALTHTSYALRDALAAVNLPFVEVHLTDLDKRKEPWRRVSVIAALARHRIMGKGPQGYVEALEWLAAQGR